jgi:ABC-type glycerol-3-phosphate transport system substrate-binding protein
MATSEEARRISRRTFLRAVGTTGGALLGAAALAACGATTAPSVAETPAPVEGAAATPAAPDYKKNKNPNFELNVSEIEYGSLHDKLNIGLQSGGAGTPDLVDIEQGRFGGYLRSEDTGLVDLTDRLKPYEDKLVAARQALYTYQGKTYGIEHALTPVVLYYRDIWEQAGVDPAKLETWDDYIAGAKQLAKDDVKAMTFPPHDVLLRQRGADYFDKDGQVTLDSDLSVETMTWILDLRDKHNIAGQAPEGDAWWTAVKEGKFISQVGADWYAGFFKDNVPDLKGKWKATALPAFEKGGLRTSCFGGTGSCIVRFSKNVEEAWKFQEHSMLSVEGNVLRFLETSLFPPLLPAMQDPRMHKPDEYYSGQDLGKVFADIAPSVPAQYQSPFRAELNTKLEPMWQDIYDGKLKPADAFKQVADEVRQAMESA